MVKLCGYKFPMFICNKTIIYCPIALTKRKRTGLRNYTRGYLYDFKDFLNIRKQYGNYNA